MQLDHVEPQWYLNPFSDSISRRSCTDTNGELNSTLCNVYCPYSPPPSLIPEDTDWILPEGWGDLSDEQICGSDGFCKHPGWLAGTCTCDGQPEGWDIPECSESDGILDVNCGCASNLFDCNDNCVTDITQAADWNSCGDCNEAGTTGGAIGCTFYGVQPGMPETSYFIYNGEVCCGNDETMEDLGFECTDCAGLGNVTCENWLNSNCVNPSSNCSQSFPGWQTDVGYAQPLDYYMHSPNDVSPSSSEIIYKIGDQGAHFCNFEVKECNPTIGDSNCNEFGYEIIVNGYDCFCDCVLPGEESSAAQLDSCGVCYGGNTGLGNAEGYPNLRGYPLNQYTNSGFGCVAPVDELYGGVGDTEWGPDIDCGCECKVGTHLNTFGRMSIEQGGYGTLSQDYGINEITYPFENCGGANATPSQSEIASHTCGCSGTTVADTTSQPFRIDRQFCFTCLKEDAFSGYSPELYQHCCQFNNDEDGCIPCIDPTGPVGEVGCGDAANNPCGYYKCADPWAINYHPEATMDLSYQSNDCGGVSNRAPCPNGQCVDCPNFDPSSPCSSNPLDENYESTCGWPECLSTCVEFTRR